MGVRDKIQNAFASVKDRLGFEKPEPEIQQETKSGIEETEPHNEVLYELEEQKAVLDAFYVHKMSNGQSQIRDKNLDPELLASAQKAAEIHMEYMYPTSEQVQRDRMDIGELDENLDNSLREYGREKRLSEVEASQEAYGQAAEMAEAQKQSAQIDPGYAALMRETGQMQQRIQDETGMTITFNENDLRQVHDFEDQCKDRIHEAVKGANPSLGDVMAESALRGKAEGSIEAARERNMELDKEYAEELGQTMEDMHMGAALDNRRQVQALEDARNGDREDALERDELQGATLSL
ncbi:MAG: hypothetical protein OSB62_01250 [Alphaproteobacteria bacterium]|nr:hypothetical protein [Alphaproteobacteria bacterium]